MKSTYQLVKLLAVKLTVAVKRQSWQLCKWQSLTLMRLLENCLLVIEINELNFFGTFAAQTNWDFKSCQTSFSASHPLIDCKTERTISRTNGRWQHFHLFIASLQSKICAERSRLWEKLFFCEFNTAPSLLSPPPPQQKEKKAPLKSRAASS